MNTYLVTGGAGFIGTNLCERLVADGMRVIVVDNLIAGNAERLPSSVTFHQIDICDTHALAEVMKGVDVVIHLAALPRVQFTIDEPVEAHRVNVDGTLSVLEAMRRTGVSRIVFATSAAIYGDQEMMPLTESMPARPKSPYGLHKYMGECMLTLWHELYGIESISLRFFNVYGPHLDPEGAYALAIGRFLKLRQEGKPITVTGDGEQTRDFVHVRDVVDAIVRASTNAHVGHGEVFNIGSGKEVSINALAALVGGPVEHIQPRVEPRVCCADATSAGRALGWTPAVTLEDGIAELKRIFNIV